MDLDVDVSRWVLELLLRDRDKESVAKRVLAAVPLSNQDWRLKKTVLLRTIESEVLDEASVTEAILESLESIEALDRGQGIPVTDSMRAAYCAVATECTVKFLICFGGKPSGKYMEAVDRIWRGRVRVLEESEGCELVSGELKERRDEVEAGIWDVKVSKKLASMNSRNDALRLVAAYVKEAFAMLGPPFIAWAVRFNMQKGSLGLEGDEVAVEKDGNVGDGCEVQVRTANGADLEVRRANGVELGDGSKLEESGANVHDGSELEAQRGANVNSGSEQEAQRANVVTVNSGSEQEAQRANGANVNSGSELEAQRVNGANDVSDRSEQEAQRVNGANDVSDRSEQEAQRANGAHVSDASEQEAHDTNVVGAGRSQRNGHRGVLSLEPATKEKETPRSRALRRRHGPVKIRDAEDVGTEASAGIYNSVSSAEVRKVQEELKSSVLALQAVVTDPLPYALQVSEIVRSELGMRPVDHVSGENGGAANPSVEKNSEPDQSNNDNHGNQTSHQNDVPQPSGKENDATNLSVNKGKGTEYVRTGDVNPGNPSCSYQNNVSRAGLMERNSTAHTLEWDDSLGMSPERTKSKGRLHLPSPKRNAVSPLKKYEDKRFSKRRKVKRWSLHEEDTLRTGVQKYGRGNWKFILDTYRDVFEERTEVDLKDKWRNMTK
ncbi:uncharacterized protein LOC133733697 isoform X2 [Rosa rugosa]|uniref:uncharacterized protein LOC133733697 isoform X1 n=1 Tax=Rosa rugosa TaxID=74645 RepID=UPI002B408671|nr:uncharacterized protein LOC133733697 isoform X1 [Rosa rugosa]XP_062017323.1 uncharacterized protein LOC133733697 isoform X2 [Rosa rugosa]